MALCGAGIFQMGQLVQVTPAWAATQSSRLSNVFVDNAPGDITINLSADAGAGPARCAWFGNAGSLFVSPASVCVGITSPDAAGLTKRVTCLEGDPLGARSDLADYPVCLVGITECGPLFGSIRGVGSIVGGTATWLNVAMGYTGVITRPVGVGSYLVTPPAGYLLDPARHVVVATPRGAIVAGTAKHIHITQAGGAVRFDCCARVGAGAASDFANFDLDFLIVDTASGSDFGAELFACGSVIVNGVVGPAGTRYNWQGPRCGALAYNGVNSTTITLGENINAATGVVLVGYNAQQANGALPAQADWGTVIAAGPPSTLTITGQQEPNAGGATAAATGDMNYDFAIFRLNTANEYKTE